MAGHFWQETKGRTVSKYSTGSWRRTAGQDSWKGQPRQDIRSRTIMTGHKERTVGKGQSGQVDLADKPGQAILNRTEREGWLEHDRKDRTTETGSHKRTDS